MKTVKILADDLASYSSGNRAELWKLRDYWGKELQHYARNALGELYTVTGEHADRLLIAGQAVYIDKVKAATE